MTIDERIQELGNCIFNAADQLKGQEIRALDLTGSESYTDMVFIISGSSNRQVQAIADRIREDMSKLQKVRPLGIEGYEIGEWVLVDFGDIIVHVFLDEKRPDYQLEEMWPNINTIDGDSIPKFLKKRSGTQDTSEKAVAKKGKVKKKSAAQSKAATRKKVSVKNTVTKKSVKKSAVKKR